MTQSSLMTIDQSGHQDTSTTIDMCRLRGRQDTSANVDARRGINGVFLLRFGHMVVL
jgi:hypothetical protein